MHAALQLMQTFPDHSVFATCGQASYFKRLPLSFWLAVYTYMLVDDL